MTVSPSALNLQVGNSAQLTVKDFSGALTWTSDNTSVVTVMSKGNAIAEVQAVAEGKANILIKDDSETELKCPVSVFKGGIPSSGLNGTWRIDSGTMIASDDTRRATATYVPGSASASEFDIKVTKNDFDHLYSIILTGKGVEFSGTIASMIETKFARDDNPSYITPQLFTGGGGCFSDLGNNVYEETTDDPTAPVTGKFRYSLQDDSTLRWNSWADAKDWLKGGIELTLKRVK